MKNLNRRSLKNVMRSFQKINEEDIVSGHHFLLKKRTVSIDHIKNLYSARKALKTVSSFQTLLIKRTLISNDSS